MSENAETSLVVAILAFLSAALVSVLMASGTFAYLDTKVGILLFTACVALDRPELHRGPAQFAFALVFGGAFYLIVGVFVEPVLLSMELEELIYFSGDSCDRGFDTARAYLQHPCRNLPYAAVWAVISIAAYIILKNTRKPLEA